MVLIEGYGKHSEVSCGMSLEIPKLTETKMRIVRRHVFRDTQGKVHSDNEVLGSMSLKRYPDRKTIK